MVIDVTDYPDVMELLATARCSQSVQDDPRKAQLSKFFQSAHDLASFNSSLVGEGFRHVVALHAAVDIIDKRIGLIRIKVSRLNEDTVEIRLAVAGLDAEALRDDIASFKQIADIAVYQLIEEFSV